MIFMKRLNTLNYEFRDYTANNTYPFDIEGDIQTDLGFIIDNNTFLDLILHPVGSFTMPFKMESIEMIGEKLVITFTDNGNKFIGETDIAVDDVSGYHYIFSAAGSVVGTITTTPAYLTTLYKLAATGPSTFSNKPAIVSSLVCYPQVASTSTVKVNGTNLLGEGVDVTINKVNANIHFNEETGRLDVYNDTVSDPSFTGSVNVIKTINGVVPNSKCYYVYAGSDSNARVLTYPEDKTIYLKRENEVAKDD